MRRASRRLPGFGLSLGLSMLYLGLVVLLPLGALLARGLSLAPSELLATLAEERTRAALALSFGCAAGAAVLDAVLGSLVAWVLVRYRFPLRSLLDAAVDLPFALPTAVAGIALTALWAETGWLGGVAAAAGVKVAYTRLGILLALAFVGLPFAVRTLQPVLEDLAPELEDSAAMLGASRLQTFRRVLLPEMLPAVGAGFTLALARALGEYGSVIFIAGNLPGRTEIAPLLVVIRLEGFDVAGAVALGLVLLAASFVLLLAINLLQRRVAAAPEAA